MTRLSKGQVLSYVPLSPVGSPESLGVEQVPQVEEVCDELQVGAWAEGMGSEGDGCVATGPQMDRCHGRRQTAG